MSDAILLPYQARWVSDRAPVKVYEKGRQIGISWTEASDCALLAASENALRPDHQIWYVGYNKEMAQEFVETCAQWARRYNKAASEIEAFEIDDETDPNTGIVRKILTYQITFASGHRIAALSSRPSNFRGKHGIAILDEAAFHDDLPKLMKAAMALLIWGGQVRIISTHNGDANPFNELVTNIRADRLPYSLHRTTFDDAIEHGLYRRICQATNKEWSEPAQTQWRQQVIDSYGDDADEELFCIPSAGSGVFLPAALIESRMDPEIPVFRWSQPDEFTYQPEERRKSETRAWCEDNLKPLLDDLNPDLMSCFGEDFGRTGDLTVIWPMQLQRNLMRRAPFVVELRNIPFDQQKQILLFIVDRLPRLIGGALDARGNGQYLAEAAAQKYGERIEQVMLSIPWYRDNMPRYKAAFEDGTIQLPRDSEILSDHRAVKVEKGVAQVPDRREVGKDGGKRHGDAAIAGALAWYASIKDPVEYAYTPVPRRRSMDEGEGWRDPFARPDHRDDRDNPERRLRRNQGTW